MAEESVVALTACNVGVISLNTVGDVQSGGEIAGNEVTAHAKGGPSPTMAISPPGDIVPTSPTVGMGSGGGGSLVAKVEDSSFSSEEDVSSSSDSDIPDSDSQSTPKAKGPKKYTCESSKMKYFIRKPYGMSQDDFARAGKELSRRTHILDLRCPEFDESIELSDEVAESNFDAIKINSWPIIKALAKIPSVNKISDYSKASAPYVFWKPFTMLAETADEVEDHVEELKKEREIKRNKEAEAAKNSSQVSLRKNDSPKKLPAGAAEANAQEAGGNQPNLDPTHKSSPALAKSKHSLAKLKQRESDDDLHINDVEYFVKFVKTTLKRDLEKEKMFRSGAATEVNFEDIHRLFRPVPDAYVAGRFDGVLRAFQIAAVTGGSIRGSRRYDSKKRRTQETKTTPLELQLLYLDFDGTQIVPVTLTTEIPYYDGAVAIRSLKVFPYIFLNELERKELDDRGARFFECTEAQNDGRGLHRHYRGTTENELNGSKDEVDEPVIIDHALAVQYNTNWKGGFALAGLDLPSDKDFLFSGTPREGSAQEYGGGMATTWSDNRNRNSHQEHARILRELCLGTTKEAIGRLQHLKFLANFRVFAYALRSRKWVCLDIQNMTEMPSKTDGFESLVLPPGHKEIVKALVQMHSQASGDSQIDPGRQLDLVRGKGKGLLVLLHGAPGVGKTSTAECVAEYTNRPLFSITCGDIGHEPGDVSKNLEENFRLAHRWGCVLLLDEADVFLAKRDRENLKRNSLVSIFLRVLEYYPGILFLTTNRVGIFDEAFKSRIHMSLYYPPLDKAAYLAIWDMNLKRIQEMKPEIVVKHDSIMRYAKSAFQELNWNGRQIRNAVQTAQALSEFRAKDRRARENPTNPDVPRQPVLDKSEFKKVAKAAKEFDLYMVDIYGGQNEADLARQHQLRADARPTAVPTQPMSSARSNAKRVLLAESESEETEDSEDDDSDSHTAKKDKKKKKKKKGGKAAAKKDPKSRRKPKKEAESESEACSEETESDSD